MSSARISRFTLRLIGAVMVLVAFTAFATPAAEAAPAGELACGDVVTESVKLTADLVDCFDNGLVIGADNITIDGNGHSVLGAWARFTGVLVDGHRNVRIKNLTVGGFCVGIEVLGSANVTLDKVTVDFNQCLFLSVSNSERLAVTGSTFSGSGGSGVAISTSDKVRLMDNALDGADGGYFFIEVDGARVMRNVSYGTYLGNFVLDGTTNSTLLKNHAGGSNTNYDYIVTDDSTGNRIAQNESTDEDGFLDESSGDGTAGTANTYQGNTCTVASDPEGLCEVQAP